MPSTSRSPDSIQFVLDANLSANVAKALALVGLPYRHVSDIPRFEGPKPGQSTRSDEDIAAWCARAGLVLVTLDDDFRARTVKTAILAGLGVEVIVISHPVAGAEMQLLTLLRLRESWCRTIADLPSGGRIWVQDRRRPLALYKRRGL